MKKLLPACMVAAAILSSCSLLQRNSDEGDADSGRAARLAHERESDDAPPFPPQKGALADDTSQPASTGAAMASPAAEANPSYEAEIARMSTKIAALETKVDVLSANLEKAQLRNSQPVIQGNHPSNTMAAPVEEAGEGSEAPAEPVAVNAVDAPSSSVEKDFRDAMDLFQAGQNMEAASRFALVAKKYPRHLLASHALYWAGEAAYRGQQWALAKENWQELKADHPHSTYMPEALAGLSRISEKEGNVAKAKEYKNALFHSFPKSPVAVAFNETAAAPASASSPAAARNSGEVNHRTESSDDYSEAPVFQENSGDTGGAHSSGEAASEPAGE